MSAYLAAVEELHTNGFISEKTLASLTPSEVTQAIEAAGAVK